MNIQTARLFICPQQLCIKMILRRHCLCEFSPIKMMPQHNIIVVCITIGLKVKINSMDLNIEIEAIQ